MNSTLFRVIQRSCKITGIVFSLLLIAGCVAPQPYQSSGSIYSPPQQRVYSPAQQIYTPTQRIYTPAQQIYRPVQRIYTPVPTSPTIVRQPTRVYDRDTTIYRNTYNYGKPNTTQPARPYSNQPYGNRNPPVRYEQHHDYRYNPQQSNRPPYENRGETKYEHDHHRYENRNQPANPQRPQNNPVVNKPPVNKVKSDDSQQQEEYRSPKYDRRDRSQLNEQ